MKIEYFTALIGFGLFSSALAQTAPLINSTQSFTDSPFCQQYTCIFEADYSLGKIITESRYLIDLGSDLEQSESNPTQQYVLIDRGNISDKIIAINFFSAALGDTPIYPESPVMPLVLDLIETAIGQRPQIESMMELDNSRETIDNTKVLECQIDGKRYLVSENNYRLAGTPLYNMLIMIESIPNDQPEYLYTMC